MEINRRSFVKGASMLSMGSMFNASCATTSDKEIFKISLAQWSLHKKLFAKELDNLQFPEFTKKTFGIDGVEYVNKFFKSSDTTYLSELKKRCDDHGVKSLLIMCDGLGQLGDANEAKRKLAVENHYTWVEAAKFLGCHSIRVNARSKGSYEEQMGLAADGLASLSTFAKQHDINVIVENHGGLSSNGEWLSGVMKKVNMSNCGTLPDFGNFHEYDRYQGVKELMPFAKGVSAKSDDFDGQGKEIHTDYEKMLKIVLDTGYRGYVGVEYEGKKLNEVEGIKATRDLLLKVRSKYASIYKA